MYHTLQYMGVLHFDLRESHPLPLACSPTPIVYLNTKGIVVEPSSIRCLAADYPIHIIFKTFTPDYISCLCCSLYVSKDFPAIREVVNIHHCMSDLFSKPLMLLSLLPLPYHQQLIAS